jgi:hypothetical protein
MSISDAFTNNEYLFIGEIGDENVLVRESILSLQFDLAATMVSEIQFEVYDPGFKMLNSNFFMIGRRVAFVLPETITLQESDGEDVTVSIQTVEFEIAAIAASHGTSDTVTVTARSRPMQQMRREKGQRSYGRISPTAFASAAAARFGLKFFGESTPVDGNIIREQHEQKDESTFDVLSRLAREAEFMFFEANGIMYFASEEFIIARQPSMEINVPSANTDPFFASSLTVRRSTDSRNSAATLQASLIKNTSSITVFPGVGVTIKGLDNFDKKFMVDRVSFDTTKTGFVAISGTCPEDSDDMGCEQTTFALGSSGECVKRIQKAVSAAYAGRTTINVPYSADEIYVAQQNGIDLRGLTYVKTVKYSLPVDGKFGPKTEIAVRSFQTLNGLPVDGIIDADDWLMIKASI